VSAFPGRFTSELTKFAFLSTTTGRKVLSFATAGPFPEIPSGEGVEIDWEAPCPGLERIRPVLSELVTFESRVLTPSTPFASNKIPESVAGRLGGPTTASTAAEFLPESNGVVLSRFGSLLGVELLIFAFARAVTAGFNKVGATNTFEPCKPLTGVERSLATSFLTPTSDFPSR
jgi:hypothetical protein